MNETQLLRNPDIIPTDEVLASALGSSYGAYTAFIGKLPDIGIEPQWRYYTDDKAWLAKGLHMMRSIENSCRNAFWGS